MFKRHIDVVAVFAIAAGMLTLAHIPALRLPVDSIQINHAVNAHGQACEISSRAVSQLVYSLIH